MSLVQLHVYDVTAQHANAIKNFNTFGREVGMGGIFHGGVEVNQLEWSYGYAPSGSGVYSCKPKVNPMYAYRESVALGVTPLSASQVKAAIAKLRKKWMGPEYELLTNNCLHFCDVLAEALQVPKIPAWLNRMAYGADAVVTFANCVSEQMRWLGSTTSSWTKSAATIGDVNDMEKSVTTSANKKGSSESKNDNPLEKKTSTREGEDIVEEAADKVKDSVSRVAAQAKQAVERLPKD
ncbi:hypothetical protein WJX73_000089 [Symbiochloris irregularis]|uniref:PPPDE domain-containing protein n=1 Tax=Symbiochloris irregularis TaxID=706552 RepID=A0AAW1NRL4_9CHLO